MAAGDVNLFDLAAKISVDARDSDRALTDTQKKVLQLAAEFKKTEAAAKSSLSNTGKAAHSTQSNVTGLNSVLKNLSSTTVTMQGPLGGVAGRLEGLTSLLSSVSSEAASAGGAMAGMAGPLGLAAAGIVATTVAAGVLLKQLVDLGIHTADWQGKLFDMSQQVGVSVEMLSGLEVAASTTGGNLDSMAQSLIIFQGKMSDAGDATSKTGKLFKELGITSGETDEALRQAIKGLEKMGEGYKQTDAARDIFGRGAKSLLAITKETGGDLDKLINKLRAMGVLLSGDAAKAADEFNDQLIVLQYQLRGVGAVIGREMLPPILSALQSLSQLIKENQSAIGLMADSVRVLIAQPLEAWLKGNFYWLNQLGDALNYVTSRKWTVTYEIVTIGGMPVPFPSGLMGTPKPSFGEAAGGGLGPTPKLGGGGGRGGGGGGGGAKKDVLEGLKSTLASLNTEWRKYDAALLGSANSSALAAEKEKILTGIMSSLKTETKATIAAMGDIDAAIEKAIGSLPTKSREAARALVDQALAQFRLNEQTRIAGELAKQTDKLFEDWKTELDLIKQNADEYTRAIIGLERAHSALGSQLSASTKAELEYLANQHRSVDITRQLTEALASQRATLNDLKFGSDSNLESATKFVAKIAALAEAAGGATVEMRQLAAELLRVAAATDQAAADKASDEKWKQLGKDIGFPSSKDYDDWVKDQADKARDVARDLTSAIDQAIFDGFQGGIKRGMVSLMQSVLDMIKNVLLRQLEAQLTEALSKISIGGGASGGGWLSKIFGVVLGGLGGAIGGGGGGAWGKLGGKIGAPIPVPLARGMDFVPFDNFPALLHRGEKVVPAGENRGGAGSNVTVIFQVADARSLMNRETQSQVSKTYQKILMKPVLVG